MLPSRRMRKVTSARRALLGGGRNWRAICRTTFWRYTGYGNSIPSVRTLATSAPRPPAGPPPAVGVDGVGFAAGVAAFATAGFGVAAPASGVATLGALIGGVLAGGA